MTLFDPEEPEEEQDWSLADERRARDEAIGRVNKRADPEWKHNAKVAIVAVARTHPEFITDAVWDTGLPKPREARAMGVITKWAQRQGYIAPTDQFRPTAQKGCHAAPKRVWRSLIYREGNNG